MRLLLFILLTTFLACQTAEIKEINPPAEGFNITDSDPKAIEIADEVMQASGSRANWDAVKNIEWNFFGRRTLTWDKWGQKCKIEITGDTTTMVINLKDNTGQVLKNGVLVTQGDSLAKELKRAKEIWINDSYWLVMPFKLKDSGVTLKYVGRDTTARGTEADILQLTFADVGVTPDNKYLVYVDADTKLVSQWDYYSTYSDTLPRFSMPWLDYQQYDGIRLSGNRERAQLSDIKVNQPLSDSFFKL